MSDTEGFDAGDVDWHGTAVTMQAERDALTVQLAAAQARLDAIEFLWDREISQAYKFLYCEKNFEPL